MLMSRSLFKYVGRYIIIEHYFHLYKEDHRSYRRNFWSCEKPDFFQAFVSQMQSCVYKAILLSRH